MVKNLADELEVLKKLSPEERIAKLKALKAEMEEDKKKNEIEIEKLAKQSEVEIEKKKEHHSIARVVKENEEWEEKAKKKEHHEERPKKEQYGQGLEEIKDIQSQLYKLKEKDEWGYEENKQLYATEKRIEALEEAKITSKYVSDQLDVSKKVLNSLKMYRD